jgi:hypothetical protein
MGGFTQTAPTSLHFKGAGESRAASKGSLSASDTFRQVPILAAARGALTPEYISSRAFHRF